MFLIASDLHLTDNPRDEYRRGIFSWLTARAKAEDVTEIIFLGDMTDRKDNHSGAFINFIVDELVGLYDDGAGRWNVRVLRGNHDYTDPANPTLRVLQNIEGQIYWYGETELTALSTQSGDPALALFIPFQRDGEQFVKEFNAVTTPYDVAFFHQTFHGSQASSGVKLPGIQTAMFENCNAKIYSGDIHLPQKVGAVEYVGSPYQINFGDKFEGRVVLYDPATRKGKDLHYPCLRKYTLEITDPDDILDDRRLKKGDQVKVRLHLTRAQLEAWAEMVRQVEANCKERELRLFGIEVAAAKPTAKAGGGKTDATYAATNDPLVVFDEFCGANNLTDDQAATGKGLLNAN